MKCLYCVKEINREPIKSLLLKKDLLCSECRNKLKVKKVISEVDGIEVESYFKYEGMFKTLLLQYKECFDEALADVFLYDISEYIRVKYWNYQIVYIPSSIEKLNERGFNHLKGIFKQLNMKEAGVLVQRNSLTQHGKNLSERKKMIDNYFYVGEKKKNILLLDDVLTTGSSIIGAHSAIENKYSKIKTIVLAKK